MTGEPKDSAEHDDLGDAVAAEQKLLHGAPSLAEDGPRMRRDSDAGPTSETMLSASQILESQGLGARLQNLQADADEERK